MIRLQRQDKTIIVREDETSIGRIRLYENRYHARNCYMSLELARMDSAFSAELFERLAHMIGRPLQAMTTSEDVRTTDFLKAGGFECRRKCYEVEAHKEEYTGPAERHTLYSTHAGEDLYDRLCRMMYEHYIETHDPISPWTGSYSDFRTDLPKEIIYDPQNFAFIEENEIAYVHSNDKSSFDSFAAALITQMFETHETICFESDDCDLTAMRLLNLFRLPKISSFDTYIRP